MSTLASLAYFATRSVSGALAVATVSVFARLLGPAGYGHWSLLITVATFFAGVLIQPLHTAVARLQPAARDDSLLATLGRALLGATLLALSGALLIESLGLHWLPAGLALGAVVLGGAQGVFDFTAQSLSSSLQARRYGALYLAKSVIALAVGAFLLSYGAGLWGALAAMAGSYLLATLICARDVWRRVARNAFSRPHMQEAWHFVLPAGAALILGILLSWSDRLILAAYCPPAALGAYAAAGDLTLQGFGLIFSALYLAWFPRLVSAWEKADPKDRAGAVEAFSRYVQIGLLVLLPAAAGFALVSPSLARVLLGSEYQESATRLIPWFVATAFLGGLRMYVLDVRLQLARRLRQQVMAVSLCVLPSIGANLLLVPRFGIVAAAIVACAAQGLGCLASAWFGRGSLDLRLPWRDVLGVLAAVGVMAGVVSQIRDGGALALLIQVVAGVASYGVVVFLLDVAGVRAGAGRLWLGLRERMRGQ